MACAAVTTALEPPLLHTIGEVAEQHRIHREYLATDKTTWRTISVPVDHFKNDSRYEPFVDDTFDLRYAVISDFWKPGGPVILHIGGETDYYELWDPNMDTSSDFLLAALTKETNGLYIRQEHRFYGGSVPGSKYTEASLRHLTTDQALAGTAFLAQHIDLNDLPWPDTNMTAPKVPWILCGCSYAGGLAAFLRKVYPNLFLGAISSSGVTEAMGVFLEYWHAFPRRFPSCGTKVSQITLVIDDVLMVSALLSFVPQAIGTRRILLCHLWKMGCATGCECLSGSLFRL